jgi:hypothetical protein
MRLKLKKKGKEKETKKEAKKDKRNESKTGLRSIPILVTNSEFNNRDSRADEIRRWKWEMRHYTMGE